MVEKMSSTAMNKPSYFLENLYSHIGKWHYLQWTVLSLSQMFTACSSMMILLVGFQPKFRCFVPDEVRNTTNEEAPVEFDDKCSLEDLLSNQSLACPQGYEYEGGKHVSFVAEWDLVCDKGYLAELSQTAYVIGMSIGALIVTHIADRFGRKPLLLITGSLLAVVFGAVAFLPTFVWFATVRFVTGFLNLGHYDVKIVLMMEMFPARMRGTMIILDGLLWGFGITILTGLGYAFDGLNWRHVQLMMMPTFVIVIIYIFFIDESVRWLVANGKYKEARRILQKIARMNGYEPDTEIIGEDTLFLEPESVEISPDKSPVEKLPDVDIQDGVVKYNVLNILKHKRTRFILLGMCFIWFTNSLVYLGLFLMTTAMSGDRLLNVLLSAAVEIPAMGGLYLCNRWLGRKRGCIALHSTCGLALFLGVLFSLTTEGQTNVVLMQIVSVIGKFAISASFIMIYFYTSELLPTNFRAAGLGIASGVARVGSFLSPFSSFVFRKAAWAPGAVFGTLSIVASILLIFVPETRDKELPQTLEDIELWFTKTQGESNSNVERRGNQR